MMNKQSHFIQLCEALEGFGSENIHFYKMNFPKDQEGTMHLMVEELAEFGSEDAAYRENVLN